jgi:hypothetical protein
MMRAQPLSFFEKLRSNVGVHCPHANWSTVWAFLGLFNVVLLWKTTCPKCGNLILVWILGRLKSSLKSLTMCAPYACGCPSLQICKTLRILLQRSLVIKRCWTPLTTWQFWMNCCLFKLKWQSITCRGFGISPIQEWWATMRFWKCIDNISNQDFHGRISP